MKINQDTVEFVRKDFPWLKLPERAEEFIVKRIEPGFDEKAITGFVAGDGSFHPSGWIKFFDLKGVELFEVGKRTVLKKMVFWRAKWPFRWTTELPEEQSFPETIGEGLFRLGPRARDVSYVVIENEFHTQPITITLYKPPKQFGLKEWYEKILENSKAELSAQIQKIENEAATKFWTSDI